MENRDVVRKRLEEKQQEYEEILARYSPETIEKVLQVLAERRKRIQRGEQVGEIPIGEDVRSVLERMKQFEQEIKDIFVESGEPLTHITNIAPDKMMGGKIAKSPNRANNYETECGNWVFASSIPIDGKNAYVARSSQSGMMVFGGVDSYIIYGSDHMQIEKDAKGECRVTLRKPNYAYSIRPKNFRPVVTLKRTQNGNPYFEFSEEWISEEEVDIQNPEQVLKVEEITDVTELLQNYQVFCDVNQTGEGNRIKSASNREEAMQRLFASIQSGRLRYINGEAQINEKEILERAREWEEDIER